jgi:hypothetical protein
MHQRELLTCSGLRLGDLNIPAFNILRRSLIGLAFKTISAAELLAIMHTFSGVQNVRTISLAAKAVFVFPQQGVPTYAKHGSIDAIIGNEVKYLPSREKMRDEFPVHRDYKELSLTERIVFDLEMSIVNGAELLVFTTLGLEPQGIHLILNRMANACEINDIAAIDLFYLQSYTHIIGAFDRIVEVTRI